MWKLLVLLSVLCVGCRIRIDNRPWLPCDYQGVLIRKEATVNPGYVSPSHYSIGIMSDGKTMLFESSNYFTRSGEYNKENFLELRRVYLLNKLNDVVTIRWFERVSKSDPDPIVEDDRKQEK